MTKSQLRKHYKDIFQLKKSIDPNFYEACEQKLVKNILQFLESYSGVWGAYKALASEASLEGVFKSKTDMDWVFPKMTGPSLKFYRAKNSSQWQRDSQFGISEPLASDQNAVDILEIQGLLIPGLAFDRFGNRLGKGKGFYDQTLQNFSGLKIGVGFSWQICAEKLATDSHDVPMTGLITENEVIKF